MEKIVYLLIITSTIFFLTSKTTFSQETKTIFVNNQDKQASDNNSGLDQKHPLKTISKAISLSTPGTKILIYPGTYRETININNLNATEQNPITLEAKQEGTVIVSGSDNFSDSWTKEREQGLYSHPWPYNWGLAPIPPYWEQIGVDVSPIVRHRELVFVDKNRYQQVLSSNRLEPGTYFASEPENKLYVKLSSTDTIDKHSIEVSVRQNTLLVNQSAHIIFRGLVFQHAADPLQDSSANITNSANITIENCQFGDNNWGGLRLAGTKQVFSENMIVKNSTANRNGGIGFAAVRLRNSIFESNQTSGNNWRGLQGDFLGWAVAGFKALHIHKSSIIDHISRGNLTRGLWFDTNFSDVVVERGIFTNNTKEGIFLEALQGTVTLRGVRADKVVARESRNIKLLSNIIGNLHIAGFTPGFTAQPREQLENWELWDNRFINLDSSILVDFPAEDHFLDTLTLSKNIYFHRNFAEAFYLGGVPLTFSQWQEVTTQDLNSIWADPRFRDPDSEDYFLLPDSPLYNKNSWPVRTFPSEHDRNQALHKYKMAAIEKILATVRETRSYYKDPLENLGFTQGIGKRIDFPKGRNLREDFKQGTFAITFKVSRGGATKDLLLALRNEGGNNRGDAYVFLHGGKASSAMGGIDPAQPYTELEIRIEDGQSNNISYTAGLDNYFSYEQWHDLVITWGPGGIKTYWNNELILETANYTDPLFDARSPLILIWDIYNRKQGEITAKDIVLVEKVLNPEEVKAYLKQRSCMLGTDLNCDNQINFTNLLLWRSFWAKNDARADANGDGKTNTLDYLAVLREWLSP